MKATIDDKGTLIIEGENHIERLALKGWEADFANGEAGFRIGESEEILRAED